MWNRILCKCRARTALMFGIEALTSAMMRTLPGGEPNSEPTGGYWGGGGETLTAAAAAAARSGCSFQLRA